MPTTGQIPHSDLVKLVDCMIDDLKRRDRALHRAIPACFLGGSLAVTLVNLAQAGKLYPLAFGLFLLALLIYILYTDTRFLVHVSGKTVRLPHPDDLEDSDGHR